MGRRPLWRSWQKLLKRSPRPGATIESLRRASAKIWCCRAFQGKGFDKSWTFERKQVVIVLRNLDYSKADVTCMLARVNFFKRAPVRGRVTCLCLAAAQGAVAKLSPESSTNGAH